MTKIERRRRVVELHQGNYEADLAALVDRVMAAQRAEASEETGAPLRAGQKPKVKESVELAREYDALLTEAEESSVKVTVWAIGHDEWSQLADDHPPREDIPEDKERGIAAKTFPADKERLLNAKTFPPLLLRAALVDPEDEANLAISLDERIAKGDQILASLSLSRIHYVKLETAAWNVNVGDDSLPKFSLVSFLMQANDSESKPQSDSA